jgi:hypothetical protein
MPACGGYRPRPREQHCSLSQELHQYHVGARGQDGGRNRQEECLGHGMSRHAQCPMSRRLFVTLAYHRCAIHDCLTWSNPTCTATLSNRSEASPRFWPRRTPFCIPFAIPLIPYSPGIAMCILTTVNWVHHQHPVAKQRDNGSAIPGFARVFFTCFSTVADWAYSARRRGMYANGTATSAACRTLARQALRGHNVSNNGLATHLVANYEHYINRTIRDRPNASVMVIRTEQLWTDLPALDKFLKGTGDFGALQGSAYTHGSEHSTNSASSTATLNITAIQTLCCVLQSELYWYRALVESAVNLNSADREATVQATMTRCGWDSWEATVLECPQIVAWWGDLGYSVADRDLGIQIETRNPQCVHQWGKLMQIPTFQWSKICNVCEGKHP